MVTHKKPTSIWHYINDLIWITLGAFLAALGEEEKIQQERKLLQSLKVPILEDVEMQIEALLLSRKRPYRYILSGINVFFQLCGALFFLMRR